MRYRFGEYELDTRQQQLYRGGSAVQLWPKVFALLQYLVEQPGRLVTKRELLDRVWPDSHVAEGSLMWTISHARRAVEQRSGEKYPIETLHKRGYRFVAAVETLSAVDPDVSTARVRATARPFVGREAAMQQLEARLRDAEELRRGEFCVLVGPAGIGKTRCMDELGTTRRPGRLDFWRARCVEDAWAPVYLPWMLVLNEVARARPGLAGRVEMLLARLKSTRIADGDSNLRDESYWWFDGVRRLLVDAAAERPVVLALDDLQWADVASLELLAFLAPELRHQAIVVIAALRVEAATAEKHLLRRLWRYAYRIDLDQLTDQDVSRYVKLITTSEGLRADTLEALHRLTAGNPLFLEHTLRDVLARHGARPLSDLLPSAILPAPIARDTLRASLDRIEPSARDLLGIASLLGEAFDLSDLQLLAGLDPEELLRLLDLSLCEGLVVAIEPSSLHFCHALMRTVLLNDLPIQRKTLLHRRAAEALESADGSRLGEIAHHYYQSRSLGDYARVAAAAERAARSAAQLNAFADAARFSVWAIDAQALEAHVSPRTRAELLFFHAEMQARAGESSAARETITAAVELARQHGLYDMFVRAAPVLRPYTLMASLEDPYLRALLEESLAHASPGPSDTHVIALSQLSWMPPYAHDTEKSKAMSSEALELARQLQDENLLLHALHARLHALSGPDDCDALLATADEMQSLKRAPSAWAVASVLSARYGAHLHRGEMLAASAARAELGRLAHANQWPVVIWIHDRLVVQEHILRGDFAAASSALESLRRLADRWPISYAAEMHPVLQGLITLEASGVDALIQSIDRDLLQRGSSFAPIGLRPFVARLQLELGDSGAAKNALDALSLDGFAGVPRDIGYLGAIASLAVLAVRLDDRPRAARLYTLLAPYARFNTMSLLLLHEGSVSHFLGILAAYLGRDADAGRHFQEAIAMNERMGLRSLAERTRRERQRWMSKASVSETV